MIVHLTEDGCHAGDHSGLQMLKREREKDAQLPFGDGAAAL